MGTAIIKPSPDEDLYIGWSSVVDGPTWMGTRAELVEKFPHLSEPELEMVDRIGSSSRMHDLSWGSKTRLLCAEPLPAFRLLRLENLVAYTRAVDEGRIDDAMALTDPIEDECE